MRLAIFTLVLTLCGCADNSAPRPAPPSQVAAPETGTLTDTRKGFKTTIARRQPKGKSPPAPPANLFRLVKYDAPSGPSASYLSPVPTDSKKAPAIVWITGGDCNSIDQGCWSDGGDENDQSASAYRKAGLVMMFPALRGGNDNPGVKEGFLGEIDDVIAAGEFLRKLPFVDPDRIYLGGHSTGGTVALLTAECSDLFRAVFSYGPTDDVAGYGPQFCPFELSDPNEFRVRAPGRWLHCVRSPTFVIEGEAGNRAALQTMRGANKNPMVTFFEVRGADHFDVLAPVNRLIADRIRRDTGAKCNLAFTEAEVNGAMKK
jgi:dipeptidyl aminopeptidase/acylaminoacyl peptidase